MPIKGHATSGRAGTVRTGFQLPRAKPVFTSTPRSAGPSRRRAGSRGVEVECVDSPRGPRPARLGDRRLRGPAPDRAFANCIHAVPVDREQMTLSVPRNQGHASDGLRTERGGGAASAGSARRRYRKRASGSCTLCTTVGQPSPWK